MRTLGKYIGRQLLQSILVVVVAFLGLFLFFDLLNEFDRLNGNYRLWQAIQYVLLLSPGRLYELLPISVLIGALYALTNLARNSEITVMRVAGMTTIKALGMLMQIGFGLVVFAFILGEYIAPQAESMARELKLVSKGEDVKAVLNSGLWIRDGSRIINVGTVTATHQLKKIRIYQFDENYALTWVADANHAEYDKTNKTWTMYGLVRSSLLPNRVQKTTEALWQWHSVLTPEVLSVLMVMPDRMPILSLYRYTQYLEKNSQNSDRYQIAMWKKIVYPLAILVMLVLSLPFAYLHDRAGGVNVKVFLGVMLGIVFYLLNGLAANLGIINGWSASLAAIAPSTLFLLFAAFMLWRAERR